jgi:drug/metabolite transporter (DMT)-like permease
MSWNVFAVVLLAAILHATWNAIVKAGDDKLLSTSLVTTSAALVSAALLPFLDSPARGSWTFIGISALLQILYFLLVATTYRLTDLSQTYPLMRGTAPLLVAAFSGVVLGDRLTPLAWAGILGICLGVLSMVIRTNGTTRRGSYLALANALVIASYTLVDGVGVRRSGAPASYTLWVFLLTGLPLAAWILGSRRERFLSYLERHWRPGLVGGIGTVASYGLALWAMTRAPIAIVAALRETSILFGLAIAGVVLREHVVTRRVVAACIIALGAAALRLA